jgi:AcrR family transcriptional regulator
MDELKRRGRPPTQTSRQVCEALLGAAEQCLADRQFKAITVREIAALADVNPAMINYYFNSKDGLFVALIDFLFTNWEEKVAALVEDMPKLSVSPTRALVELVDECYYRHAPVHRLLTRELRRNDSAIQVAYSQRLASRTTMAIHRFIARGAELGHYRGDLDLRFAALTVATIAIHPLSIEPRTLEMAYHIHADELNHHPWLDHVEQTLDRLLRP